MTTSPHEEIICAYCQQPMVHRPLREKPTYREYACETNQEDHNFCITTTMDEENPTIIGYFFSISKNYSLYSCCESLTVMNDKADKTSLSMSEEEDYIDFEFFLPLPINCTMADIEFYVNRLTKLKVYL